MLLPRNRTKLEEFLPHVMAMVQGDSRPALPSNVAISYIRNAAIKFAQRSSVIRRSVQIKFQPDNLIYPLVDDPEEEKIHRLVRVYRGDECCNDEFVATFDDNTICLAAWDVPSDPCEDQFFTAEFVAIPTRNACSVDEILFDEWHDAIVDGALEQIHLMPQRPWTSGTASRERQRNFGLAVADARRKYFTDRAGTAPTRVRYPGGC